VVARQVTGYAVLAGVILALAAALGAALWIQGGQISRLTSQKVSLSAELSTAQKANAAQLVAIAALTTANDGFVAAAKVQHAAYAGALADLTRANLSRAATRTALLAREAAERASVSCGGLLAIDLAVACPVVAQGVRERAR